MLQLQQLFPHATIHGINKRPWKAMQGQSSLRTTATYYKIFTKKQVQQAKLPHVHFYDATHLQYPDESFDVIYSQVAIPYVKEKHTLIEEIYRVLKPHGKAILNIDNRHENPPDFLAFTCPHWIIYKQNKVISLQDIIKELQIQGFVIQYEERTHEKGTRINLYITKTTQNKKQLKLPLALYELSSFYLGKLNTDKPNWNTYWGYRSVYTYKS